MIRPIKRRPKRRVSKSRKTRKTRLDALVAEAVVDCYGESEQITGLYTMMDSHLSVPFKTMVLGVPVTVERVDLNQREEIVAVCRRARIRQTVPILDLPLPSPPPAGAEWIDAYRYWLLGG
jgi:calcium binding protein